MLTTFEFLKFNDLSNTQLYELLKLRIEVFVVEQNCPYQDLDGKDLKEDTVHVLGYDEEGELVAYCRILAPGVSYPHAASIGRVITSAKGRGKGVGRELMKQAVQYSESIKRYTLLTISAQSHLQAFYEEIGFRRTAKKEYLEDNIPHREMERKS
ncbi:MAG: GNAT family N-acetyltransferase [Bacteroidia bacterium]|nr:GNAT family N-acetyltransferase [Bacteroidia bacterium]